MSGQYQHQCCCDGGTVGTECCSNTCTPHCLPSSLVLDFGGFSPCEWWGCTDGSTIPRTCILDTVTFDERAFFASVASGTHALLYNAPMPPAIEIGCGFGFCGYGKFVGPFAHAVPATHIHCPPPTGTPGFNAFWYLIVTACVQLPGAFGAPNTTMTVAASLLRSTTGNPGSFIPRVGVTAGITTNALPTCRPTFLPFSNPNEVGPACTAQFPTTPISNGCLGNATGPRVTGGPGVTVTW